MIGASARAIGPRRALLALGLVATPASALELVQPVDCTLGETCYIQNYVDHDPGPGASDLTCGPLTYDGHSGTDFALPTLADLEPGVAVLAAAAGEVVGTRDEMPDIAQGAPGAPDVAGRECGNGVVLQHEGGWQTQYCHLQLGSIRVRPGDQVAAGAPLGLIGLSGQTEFPHLHLSVREGQREVDPFDPDGEIQCGAPSQTTLWVSAPPYRAGGLLALGWSEAVPDYAEVRAGTASQDLTPTSPAMVLHGLIFGGRAGDQVEIVIDGPAGRILDHAETLERDQALLFRAAGLRRQAETWPSGRYIGEVTLRREGLVETRTTEFTLP